MRVLDAASKGWTLGEMYMVLDEAGEHIASAEYIWGDSVPDRDVQAANVAIIVHAQTAMYMLLELAESKVNGLSDFDKHMVKSFLGTVENTYKELTTREQGRGDSEGDA